MIAMTKTAFLRLHKTAAAKKGSVNIGTGSADSRNEMQASIHKPKRDCESPSALVVSEEVYVCRGVEAGSGDMLLIVSVERRYLYGHLGLLYLLLLCKIIQKETCTQSKKFS